MRKNKLNIINAGISKTSTKTYTNCLGFIVENKIVIAWPNMGTELGFRPRIFYHL